MEISVLKKEMKLRGYTARALAKKIGKSPNAISSWIHGKNFPSVESMQKLKNLGFSDDACLCPANSFKSINNGNPGYINLPLNFKAHRKRKKLFNRFGSKGIVALIDFLITTAETNPEGILRGYDYDDIEIDAGWDGEQYKFAQALFDTGFLIRSRFGTIYVADWRINQPHLYEYALNSK